MNAQSRRFTIQGPVGAIEAVEDLPSLPAGVAPRGVAVIAHPHPLFAGTMDNKVVQTLARAFVQCGWRAVRFNFRGVGATDGIHDAGRGELQDLLAVIDHASAQDAAVPLALAGFSFGSFVVSHAVEALGPQRVPQQLVLIGTAATRFDVATVPQGLHTRTLVVHGELDDTVPLADVMNWARPQTLPVTVVPGGSHFFHGQLPLLRGLVVRHLMADPERIS
ncbi:MAG: alpha/beta hydrolase [Burkholderiales bacterium]|nr:alpha/beta hydrolase [Burkholderiales bacterium]